MQEPLTSIDPVDWSVWADWCFDHDIAGEARARRIAATLASGRTGLYLWFHHPANAQAILSELHWECQKRSDTPFKLVSSREDSYSWSVSPTDLDHRSLPPLVSPVAYPEVFCDRPDVVRAFFDRLHELGPFLWLAPDNPTVAVPPLVAVCPECGGTLEADVETTTEPGGVPCSVSLGCVFDDPPPDQRGRHHNGQADWQPVRDRVERWARDHVRVKAEEDLRQEEEK